MASEVLAQSSPTNGDFALELHQGPVIANARITGLGGAFTGVAEGTGGMDINPAAVANRPYHSLESFDYDYDWDVLIPGAFQGDEFDYFNSGDPSNRAFVAFSVGGHLQFGELGIGILFRGQSIGVEQDGPDPQQFDLNSGLTKVVAGYSLLNDELLFGAGVNLGFITLNPKNNYFSFSYSTFAIGGVAGALYRPRNMPYRIGLAIQTPFLLSTPSECGGKSCPDNLVLPNGVATPFEMTVGASWFLPIDNLEFNPEASYRQPDPDELTQIESGELDESYRGGRYVMVAFDLRTTGTTENTVGIVGIREREFRRTGESITVSPRLGVETEMLPRRLRLRLGTYYEPSRYTGIDGRLHGTFSAQVRMFDWDVPLLGWKGFSFSSAIDLAPKYSNVILSVLTFWH
jgi:hypothetical protein